MAFEALRLTDQPPPLDGAKRSSRTSEQALTA
jgi:hypothetical protein